MTAIQIASLPHDVRQELHYWRVALEPLLDARPITTALQSLSRRIGKPYKTVERKYYALKRGGPVALINRRSCGPVAWQCAQLLSDADKELVKQYCENYQRKSLPAIRALRRDWISGNVSTSTGIDTRTGFPTGWSERNLMRHISDKLILAAARIGRSASANERRLVYSTRENLWVGSHYMFDDMWHDHFVNVLDQAKAGRPLEFHALDVYSACKFAYGMSVRLENDGRMEGLKESDMRFLLASVLGGNGYSPRGTTLIVEHGTAAIREDLERLLHDETNGLITVSRSSMEGAAAASHQYAGRAKGNFRFKGALESLGNLIHNEMAHLPAQTGMDIDRRPEQTHGILKRNDALLKAMSQLAPERVAMLRWPILTIQQFRIIAAEIYARINDRTDHDLQGWDALYLPDRRTGLSRRMSPSEVWKGGSRQLTRLRPEAVAMILLRDTANELTVRRGIIEIQCSEVSGDPLRFDARLLPDREKYLTVINPYSPDAAYCFDSRRRFIAACPRIHTVCTLDHEALQRECGAAAKAESERLAPFRARHAAEARQKAADMRHNAAVVSGGHDDAEAGRVNKSATRLGKALQANTPAPQPEPADTGIIEDWGDSPTPSQHPTDNVETW